LEQFAIEMLARDHPDNARSEVDCLGYKVIFNVDDLDYWLERSMKRCKIPVEIGFSSGAHHLLGQRAHH
tara:strand:+ start:510 stop:716 length:207 start_codon:yes stop_codon:yes gene_type:complete